MEEDKIMGEETKEKKKGKKEETPEWATQLLKGMNDLTKTLSQIPEPQEKETTVQVPIPPAPEPEPEQEPEEVEVPETPKQSVLQRLTGYIF